MARIETKKRKGLKAKVNKLIHNETGKTAMKNIKIKKGLYYYSEKTVEQHEGGNKGKISCFEGGDVF